MQQKLQIPITRQQFKLNPIFKESQVSMNMII